MADVGTGSVAVVGQRLDQERDPAGPVALVEDRLDLIGVDALARSLGDRPLDVVLGHRRIPRLLDRQGECRVAVDVAASLAGRDGDGAGQLGEVLTAALVDDRFLVLDGGPFGVTGHACNYRRGRATPIASRGLRRGPTG